MDRRTFLTAAGGAVAASAALATPALAIGRRSTIVDLAVATPELSTLVTAVSAAGLVDTLSGPGPFTVFAPTNRAFEHLPHGVLDGLLADIPALTQVLTYHVSAASYPAEALIGQRGRIPTVQGGDIFMNGQHGGVVLNRSINVTTPDIFASNGIVHIIDGVLLPH